MARLDFDKLNSEIRYLMFSVFQVEPGVLGDDREAAVKDARLFFEGLEDKGVVVRGIYDVAGLRADADFMIWTHAATIEELQAAYADSVAPPSSDRPVLHLEQLGGAPPRGVQQEPRALVHRG